MWQVNRELMNVIESLQREENNSESGAEAEIEVADSGSESGAEAAEIEGADSGSDFKEGENLGTVAGDKENCDVNSVSLEEAKDKGSDAPKSLTSSKAQKRKRSEN